jgi:flagellar biosynthetic protein FlhB
MSDSSQDRTEQATPKRKRESRKRGEVPRSRELGAAAVVGAGAITALSAGPAIGAGAVQLMHDLLQFDAAALADPQRLPAVLGRAWLQGMLLCAPLLAACAAAALLAPILLGGWNFSPQALRPDFSRLNPLSGLGRILSSHGLVELLKSLVKVCWIGGVGALYLWHERNLLAGLSAQDPRRAIADGTAAVLGSDGWMALALLTVAGFDVPFQLWSHAKRLRMSKQEVRDEYKQSEGRPEVKGKLRRLQMEMAKRRMMEKVPTADVVVTNPSHYAVALQYSSGEMRAPRVVAKGSDELAAVIRELAREHRIPVVAAPPLARALYRSVELEQEIPANLYAAVARVLSYVYQLRAWRGGTRPPQEPVIEAVPGGEPDPQ